MSKYKFTELVLGYTSPSRHKAIGTLAKRKNISYEAARKYQAKKILENGKTKR